MLYLSDLRAFTGRKGGERCERIALRPGGPAEFAVAKGTEWGEGLGEGM